MARRKSRILTQPEPGFWVLRLVPKGWQVPARIERDDEGRYSVEIDGREFRGAWTSEELEAIAADSIERGKLFEHPLLRVSGYGEPCDEATYRYRNAMRVWAAQNRRDHPAANPMVPIDVRTLPAEDF